ncbi:MAG: fibronectin type III domain-containing protein, partial [bacterium]|nr:fibronectin type III domain-containing protein [bacterium]
ENKRFIYRVIVFDTYLRESSASAPQLINIIEAAGEKPRAPSDFNYVVTDEHTVTLYWKPVTAYQDGTSIDQNLKGYEIYRSNSTTRGEAPLALVGQNNTSYNDSELDYDTTYYYWIASVDASGAKSSYSDPISVRILLGSHPTNVSDVADYIDYPASPHIQSVISTNNPNGTVNWNITWEKPIYNSDKTTYDDHSEYRIYRSESPEGFFQLMGASSSARYDFTVPSIINYYFRITAVDQYGNESLPSGTGFDKASLPDINTSTIELRIGASDDEEVNLKWKDVGVGSELDYYYIYRAIRPEGPYIQVGSGVADDDRTTEYDVTDITVVSGVNYYFRLRGSNSSGLSGYTYYAKSGTEATTASFEAEEMIRSGAFPALESSTNNTPYVAQVDDGAAGASNGDVILYVPDEAGPTSGEDYSEWRSPIQKAPGTYKVRVRYKNLDDTVNEDNSMGEYDIKIYQESALFGGGIGGPAGDPLVTFSIKYVTPGSPLPDGTDSANEAYQWTDWYNITVTETIIPWTRDRYLYFRAVWKNADQGTGASTSQGRFYFDAVEINNL